MTLGFARSIRALVVPVVALLTVLTVGVAAPAAFASTPAPTWTSVTTLTPDGQSDPVLNNDRIDVTMGSEGDAAVGWLSGMANGSGPGIVSAAYRAGRADATWEVSTITSAATAISEPRVAVAANGDAIVVWEQSDGLYAAYRPAGLHQDWTAPQQVDAGSDVGPSIVMDADGNAIVAYASAGTVLVAYRPAGTGSTWSSAQRIIDPSGTTNAGAPQVSLDAVGNAQLVYPIDHIRLGCGFYDCWGVAVTERAHDTGTFGTNSFDDARQLLGFCCADVPALNLAEGPDGSAALSVGYPHNNSYLAYRPAGQADFDAPVLGSGTVSVDPAGNAFAVQTGQDYFHTAGSGQSWTAVGTGPFVPAARWNDQYAPSDGALDSAGQAVVVGVETDESTYGNNAVAAVRGTDGTWSPITRLNDTNEAAGDQRVATDGQGDATVAWVEAVGGKDVVRVADLVGGPALWSLSVPSTVLQGYPVTFSVDPRDAWHSISNSDVVWTFTSESDPGDSVTDTGPSVSHGFSGTGVYDVSVTAKNDAGTTVTSPVERVTVTNPDAVLTADTTSGTAPLTVHLDASRSTAPPGATYAFYCGDSDTPVAPASSATSATCTYDRGSPDAGWEAHVIMHDPSTDKDYQDHVYVQVAPVPDTVDDSAAFDAAHPDYDITVASDGSLSSDTCTGGQVDSYCTTLYGSPIVLTAAPGTFATDSHVLIYHGDTTTLQSELGPNVQAEGGFAVVWTPDPQPNGYGPDAEHPLNVTIDAGTQSASNAALRTNTMRHYDLGSFFSGIWNGMASGTVQAVTTGWHVVSSAAVAVGGAVGGALHAAWNSFTQSMHKPNGSDTNNVFQCGQVEIPSIVSVLDPIRCTGGYSDTTGVPTDQFDAMSHAAGVIAAGGGNVIAAGGGNVIAAGGGNVIAAGGGNFVPQGPSLVMLNTAAGVIAAGGGNVIAAGGGNFISEGLTAGLVSGMRANAMSPMTSGGTETLTLGFVEDPGIGFAAPTSSAPPTVTATPDPAVPGSGSYTSGPVTVHLNATPADGATVQNISYEASGAERILNTQVAGNHTDVVIDQPGSTTITYTAQDDSLNQSDPQTITIDIAQVPGAPQNVAAAPGNGKATVTFDPPVDNGGTSITGYTVTAHPDGVTGTGGDVVRTGTRSPVLVDGLTNGTLYDITVVASNAAGDGPASDAVQVTPMTTPGAPRNVAATAGDSKATVSFDPPSSDGGSAITEYTVNAHPHGASGTSGDVSRTGNGSPMEISELTNGTVYDITVVATNAVGDGAASDPVQVTPEGSTPPPPPPPGTQSGLLDTDSGTSNTPTGTASATSTSPSGSLTVVATGKGTVTAGQYSGQPASTGDTTFSASGGYVDVFTSSGSAFSLVKVTDCVLDGGSDVYWWDTTAGHWRRVQPQSYDAGPPACVTFTLDSTSSPSLNQLTGTVFASARPVSPTVSQVTPGTAVRGAHGTLTVGGSGFLSGASVRFGSPSAIQPNGTPMVAADGKSITVPVIVGRTATPGPVEVTVTNPDSGWASCGDCLSVAYPPRIGKLRLPAAALASHVRATYGGSETAGTITGYDIRTRRAASRAKSFASWHRATTATGSRRLALHPGDTICVDVRARDGLGQVSSWSPTRCVSRPLGVRSLTASPQWGGRRGSGYYDGSALVTATKGATLTVRNVPAHRLGIVVTRCPNCGVVAVSVNGHRVGVIDTSAATKQRRAVVMLSYAGRRARKVTLTTLTNRRVTVQGLLVARHAPG